MESKILAQGHSWGAIASKENPAKLSGLAPNSAFALGAICEHLGFHPKAAEDNIRTIPRVPQGIE